MSDDDSRRTDAASQTAASGPVASGRRGRRAQRGDDLLAEFEGNEGAFVVYFKERVYATFTGLAIVLVVNSDDHADAAHALLALLLGVLGITVAGFVSDVISHLAVRRDFPGREEFLMMGRVASGALGTVAVPGILLFLAWLDIMPLTAALRASAIVYIVTLAIIGWFAVRRSRLEWWKQLIALAVLVALGLAVVLLQTLAHAV